MKMYWELDEERERSREIPLTSSLRINMTTNLIKPPGGGPAAPAMCVTAVRSDSGRMGSALTRQTTLMQTQKEETKMGLGEEERVEKDNFKV